MANTIKELGYTHLCDLEVAQVAILYQCMSIEEACGFLCLMHV